MLYDNGGRTQPPRPMYKPPMAKPLPTAPLAVRPQADRFGKFPLQDGMVKFPQLNRPSGATGQAMQPGLPPMYGPPTQPMNGMQPQGGTIQEQQRQLWLQKLGLSAGTQGRPLTGVPGAFRPMGLYSQPQGVGNPYLPMMMK